MADDNADLDVFGVSDEEFLKNPGAYEASAEDSDDQDTPEDESGEDSSEASDETADDDEGTSDSNKDAPTAKDSSEAGDGGEATDDPPSAGEENETPDAELTAEDFRKRITAEFKANGKMMKVDNVDDVIRLMQMGANYSRKMAGLKPNLRVLRMLEKADLLDESKLSFLIDLNAKNPQAITRLLKDSELDPLDLDMDSADQYKASNHSVDEREIALGDVVEDIKDSEHYPKVIRVVTKEWDAASKQAVADEPQLLKVLEAHMASGAYDLISTEIEKERMFGRLGGMSDLEAYSKVGDAIHARGGFAHLYPRQGQGQQQPTANGTPAAPNKPKDDDKRRDKRRAASPSQRAAPASKTDEEFNPLAMSDEEFLAQGHSKFQ